MIALVAANIVNASPTGSDLRHFGAPAMGVRGSAWATLVARIFMAGVAVRRHRPARAQAATGLFETPLAIDLGVAAPAVRARVAGRRQMTLEVGVFAAATALAGRAGADALAAHQIALNIAAFTFMVPLGVASAAAVRVGPGVGRRDPRGAASAGWTAIAIGVGFMACAARGVPAVPRALIGAFTATPACSRSASSLLFVAAVFQLFDGVQGVTTGALRGLGDTRTAMLWNLVGHWSSACRSATCSASRWGSASSASGGACRPA